MKVSTAKAVAGEWVKNRISELPNVTHAFLQGSVMIKDEDENLPATSDVDIRIVVDQDVPPMFTTLTGPFAQKYYKIDGVILDTTYMTLENLNKQIAAFPGELIAVDFYKSNAIYDSDGTLDRLYQRTRITYRDIAWVRQRCKSGEKSAQSWFIQAANSNINEYGWNVKRILDFSWLYLGAAPAVSQIPCVADLRGMTFRTCLVKSRNTLTKYGFDDLYDGILNILGLVNYTKSDVEDSLDELSNALHYARSIHKTRYYGDHHLQEILEPLIFDGSQELIDVNLYQEALLWIAGMRDWVQNAIENDGREPEKSQFRSAFDGMLTQLGITDDGEITRRSNMLRQYIPDMMGAANKILEENPHIYRQR